MAALPVKIIEIQGETDENNTVLPVVEPAIVVETPIEEDGQKDHVEVPTEKTETVEPPPEKNHKFNRKSGKYLSSKERVDELVSCKKCGKMVLAKTLNYSHLKTCAKHDEPFVPVRELNTIKKTKVKVKPVAPPTEAIPVAIPAIPQIAQPQLTYQEMRRDYHRNGMSDRKDQMQKLFLNAI